MNVRGVAGQQHPPLAVGRYLLRAVGPCTGEAQRLEGHVGAGYAPQDRLHVLARDRLGAMECAAVEVGNRDHSWLPLRVHTGRRVMTSQGKYRRVGDFDADQISRELRLSTDELE